MIEYHLEVTSTCTQWEPDTRENQVNVVNNFSFYTAISIHALSDLYH